MEEIRIVDTTLRDGNTSLWAHNMTTGMMHPALRHMDQAGFDAMEFFVAGRFCAFPCNRLITKVNNSSVDAAVGFGSDENVSEE